MGGRQTPVDATIRLVSISLGQAFELEGDGRGFRYKLASCIPFSGDGSELGIEASVIGRNQIDWC